MTDANGGVANVLSSIDAGNGKVYVIDAVLLPAPSAVGADAGASSPVAERLSAEDAHNALDRTRRTASAGPYVISSVLLPPAADSTAASAPVPEGL